MCSVVGSHSGSGARNACGVFGTEDGFEIVASNRKRFKPVTRSPRQPRRIGKPSPHRTVMSPSIEFLGVSPIRDPKPVLVIESVYILGAIDLSWTVLLVEQCLVWK